MKVLLFISALISFVFATLLLLIARGGIHEATSAGFYTVSAVSFAGAAIVESLQRIERLLRTLADKAP